MATMMTTAAAQEFLTELTAKARELGIQPCDLVEELTMITPKRRGRPPTKTNEVPATYKKRKYVKVRPESDATENDVGSTELDTKGRTWIVVEVSAFKGTKKIWKIHKQAPVEDSGKTKNHPSAPPKDFEAETIQTGNDGKQWIVTEVPAFKGVRKMWTRVTATTMVPQIIAAGASHRQCTSHRQGASNSEA